VTHDLIAVSQRRADLMGITMGRIPEATALSAGIQQRILAELARYPDHPVFQSDLATTYGRLIILRNAAADTTGAIADCRAYLDLTERMIRARPSDQAALRGALVACTRMAEFSEMRGYPDSAVVYYRRAERFARDAVRAYPNNTDTQRDLSIVLGTYGVFLAKVGQIDSALVESDRSVAIFQDLAAKDPQNVLLQSDLAEADHDIGTILLSAHRYPAAEARFRKAFDRFERIAAGDTANAESRIFMARCSRHAGEARGALSRLAASETERSRQRSQALAWLERSREIYGELAKRGQLTGEEASAPEQLDRLIAGLPSRR
jgi:tetratricopeptide (TPR) repeat protein